ncbi:MAG: hypothetical protein Pars2KO_20520 [Parasphingorhabdus sp.]
MKTNGVATLFNNPPVIWMIAKQNIETKVQNTNLARRDFPMRTRYNVMQNQMAMVNAALKTIARGPDSN